jgi:hypothetical protein
VGIHRWLSVLLLVLSLVWSGGCFLGTQFIDSLWLMYVCRHRLILYRVAGRSSSAVERFLGVNRTLVSVAVLCQLVTGRQTHMAMRVIRYLSPEEIMNLWSSLFAVWMMVPI